MNDKPCKHQKGTTAILVFEYITGGGMIDERLPRQLASEGEQMLSALVNDLFDVPQLQLTLLRDHRITSLINNRANVEWITIDSRQQFDRLWPKLLTRCDAVWPIAPENNHTLYQLCRMIEQADCQLINSGSEPVRLTSSKIATARLLQRHSIPVVPTSLLAELPLQIEQWHYSEAAWGDAPPHFDQCEWVIKPDDGVGCEGSRIIRSQHAVESMAGQCGTGLWIVQPLLAGEPLSLSLICNHGEAQLLSCNRQQIDIVNQQFQLNSCKPHLASPSDHTLHRRIATQIAAALPTLSGYVGVDFIATGDGPVVLEINPRLTTSYAGLRKALGINPAQLILDSLRL